MNTTAIGSAMAKAGIRPEDAAFDVGSSKLISVYLQSGGTNERAYARLVWAAQQMLLGGGHLASASDGQASFAPARQTVEGGEAIKKVPQGQRAIASSPSPERGGEGHVTIAQNKSHIRSAP